MKGLIVALQFLTRLPTPRLAVTTDEFTASIRWFPAAGLVVGGIVAAAGWLGGRIDPWTGAVSALLAWVAVTGALHLDGLGDIADASGAAHKGRERLLIVLADPHIGSFGTVAIVLQLLAKLVLLHGVCEHHLYAGLALIPFAARIGPLIWSRWLAPLHEGLGARFRGAVRSGDLLLWGAALFVAAWFAPALFVVLPFIGLWCWWIMHRIGGIAGDGHGAGIEIAESVMLFSLLLQ